MASSHLILRLCGGIRSVGNFSLLLVVLAAFPFLLSFTVGFGVAEAAPQNPQHTWGFRESLSCSHWTCFCIAAIGTHRRGPTAWQEVIGSRWHGWQQVLRDIAIAFAVLAAMTIIGGLSNTLLGPLHRDTPLSSRWSLLVPGKRWLSSMQRFPLGSSKNSSSRAIFRNSYRHSLERRF